MFCQVQTIASYFKVYISYNFGWAMSINACRSVKVIFLENPNVVDDKSLYIFASKLKGCQDLQPSALVWPILMTLLQFFNSSYIFLHLYSCQVAWPLWVFQHLATILTAAASGLELFLTRSCFPIYSLVWQSRKKRQLWKQTIIVHVFQQIVHRDQHYTQKVA